MLEIPVQYGYLIGLVVPAVIWAIIYWRRPDSRKEMLILGGMLAIASPVTQYLWWSVDWWYPPNLTMTRVGVEDILLGFFAGGMGVLYETLTRHVHVRIPQKSRRRQVNAHVLTIGMFVSIYGFVESGVFTSYVSTILILTIGTLVMFYFRSDLVVESFVSGVLVCIWSLVGYLPIIWLVPGWVEATYNFNYLSGDLLLWVPIEELIFWFFAGIFFGPVYEYWKFERLRMVQSKR
ncbi:MAG: lycopene cyclase domain-containing protein [Minisyncoccia bacterium]